MNGDIQREAEQLSMYSTQKGLQKKRKKKKKLYPTISDDEDLSCQVKKANIDKLAHIDYVLVYENENPSDTLEDSNERRKLEKHFASRAKFECKLQHEGIEIDKEIIGNHVFVKLHTPFERLCKEAERVRLQLPIEGGEIDEDDSIRTCCARFEDRFLKTDIEVDFISAAFEQEKLSLFEGSDNTETFFRSSLRSILTHHILINTDIRTKKERITDTDGDGDEEEDYLAKQGLPYLLMKGSYKEGFILHDESLEDPIDKEAAEEIKKSTGKDPLEISKELGITDSRKQLNDTWPKFYKYQPMWMVRNYFGEKIAFYFAWTGTLVSTLWLPTLVGLGVFAYGLYLSATNYVDTKGLENQNASALNNTNTEDGFLDNIMSVKDFVFEILEVIKEACDNRATPFFALLMCLWGTIFLEVWKRKKAVLAYEWDVNDFEDVEPDRPQYFGTTTKKDPVTGELAAFYPAFRRFLKFIFSCTFVLVMIFVVFISVAAVIVYRVIMTVDFCGSMSTVECLLVTTVASSLLNAISILILGKVYEKVAYLLTDWENHRTQTAYDDALIIKIFAFQFANSYASLFYIAFLRGDEDVGESGVFGLGPAYKDTCGSNNNCMSMLSFQVLVLMIMKPFPKLLKDILIPFIRKCIRKRKCCRKNNQVDPDEKSCSVTINDYLERERLKPALNDFTLWEYTEKVIQYGYLMLFAVALPVAPLIALLTNLFDRSTDAKRLLWIYRRPVARVSQDIGMWLYILEFVNICGVISNAFIIAYTTSFGKFYFPTDYEKLWAVLVFEHLVFGLKYLLAMMIPDVPHSIGLAMRREKYQVAKIMETGMFLGDKKLENVGPSLQGRQIPKNPSNNGDNSNGSLRRRRTRTNSEDEYPKPRHQPDDREPLVEDDASRPEKHRKRKKKVKKRPQSTDDGVDSEGNIETPRRPPHHLEPLDASRKTHKKRNEDVRPQAYRDGVHRPELVRDKSDLRRTPPLEPPPPVAMPSPVYGGYGDAYM